ncbi:MAG TPA: hypothetical protein VJ725_27190 [Thermoanaerobaculia bacterium]|nr:hypothetical protein [Thermoanaerobaculia bacterium]
MHRTWTAALLLALAAAPAGALSVELLSRVPPRRASETASGPSRPLAISADGRYTVIASEAVNLVPGMAAAPPGTYFYLHDRGAGTFTRIGPGAVSPGNLGVETPRASISADGRFVALLSNATTLLPGPRGGGTNVFLWERATGSMSLVSHGSNPANPALFGRTDLAAVSANGSYVLFTSDARNLVPNPGRKPIPTHVFLWSRSSGRIQLVTRGANGDSVATGLSDDGAWIVFKSVATNLVSGATDANGTFTGVFLANARSGRITLLSESGESPGETALGWSSFSRISAGSARLGAGTFSVPSVVDEEL